MTGFVFLPETHTYMLGDEVLPGVTTVLSLLGGYEGVPKHILDMAARRGTAVHTITEQDDAGTLDYGNTPDELLGYLMGWHKFKDEVKPVIEDAEVPGYHSTLKFAGTRDRLLQIGKKRGILDIKTCYRLMPTTGPQTAAYAHIYNDSCPKGMQVKHRWGLRLTKDGNYQLLEYTNPTDINTFLSCLNCYRYIQQHNKLKLKAIEDYQHELNN